MLKSELAQKLYQKCRLEVQIQDWSLRKQQWSDQLPGAKFAKREADTALTEYEGSTIRVWLDKHSGRWEEKRENLTRKAAAADANLRNVQRELEAAQNALAEAMAREKALGLPGDIGQYAQALEGQEREAILSLAAKNTLTALLPKLQEAISSLEEAQQWARPNNRVESVPGYTKGKLLALAGTEAKECARLLDKMGEYGIPVEVHPYFKNPAGYINGVAAQYGELDRINRALKAIRQTEKTMLEQQRRLAAQLPPENL